VSGQAVPEAAEPAPEIEQPPLDWPVVVIDAVGTVMSPPPPPLPPLAPPSTGAATAAANTCVSVTRLAASSMASTVT
jgi:hypothetical protein